MEHLPFYVSLSMALTTLLTLLLFLKAAHFSKEVAACILLWLLVQTIISLTGFYTKTYSFPPRFPWVLLPPLLLMVGFFITKKGRIFIDRLDVRSLTLLHIVRIPVEVVLYWLFLHKGIPEIMTFEGRNLDILSGLSAPFIYYFGFVKKRLGSMVILLWNLMCLALLINIVTIAILSVPTPFQKIAFDQPNIAVLYFPFVWLPCFIVPIVLLAHLTSIRSIVKMRQTNNGN